jgi:hypothetical protein
MYKDFHLDVMYRIYKELDIHIDYKRTILNLKYYFDNLLEEINETRYNWLDSIQKTDFKQKFPQLPFKYERLTNREVLETFLYGHYFHRTDKRLVSRYNGWYENPLVIGVFQSILIDFLPYLIAYILVFKSVNESVIRTYESKRFILFDFSSALDSMPDLRRIIKEKQK